MEQTVYTEYIPKAIGLRSTTIYEMWVGVYLRYLNNGGPSEDSAKKFLSLAKKKYRRNTLAVIRNALRWKFGFDLQSISIEIGEPKYASVDDVKRIIDNAPTLLERTIMILMFDTSCRISEVLNLRKKDIDWEHGVITVLGKGGHRQRVKVSDKGIEALREWLSSRRSDLPEVFMGCTYGNIYRRMKKLSRSLGIRISPHMFRHSRIVQLLESGVPLERVSNIARHRRIDTTLQIYGNLRAEDLGKYLDQAQW